MIFHYHKFTHNTCLTIVNELVKVSVKMQIYHVRNTTQFLLSSACAEMKHNVYGICVSAYERVHADVLCSPKHHSALFGYKKHLMEQQWRCQD